MKFSWYQANAGWYVWVKPEWGRGRRPIGIRYSLVEFPA